MGGCSSKDDENQLRNEDNIETTLNHVHSDDSGVDLNSVDTGTGTESTTLQFKSTSEKNSNASSTSLHFKEIGSSSGGKLHDILRWLNLE